MKELLVALDVDTVDAARRLADLLRGTVGGFKIGSRLFTAHGPAFVEELVARGDKVFLDLKFHDIPNTVATAVSAATSLGVWMLNVHASGGGPMMKAALEAAGESAAKAGVERPLVIAVTVLTSMNASMIQESGVAGSVLDQVGRLARLTQAAGLDGVVASPQETRMIRETCGPGFQIVTPGIRGGSAVTSGKDDQERTMTAPEAVAAGASYIVVGRPIIAASDPRTAAENIARSAAL
jgi:orotidine-5'-phosphate decarboxylase